MNPTKDFGKLSAVEPNAVLGAGNNPNTDDLPIYRYVPDQTDDIDAPLPYVVSCWELSPEEVRDVLETGRVFLWASGYTHPPVYLGTRLGVDPAPPEGDATTAADTHDGPDDPAVRPEGKGRDE